MRPRNPMYEVAMTCARHGIYYMGPKPIEPWPCTLCIDDVAKKEARFSWSLCALGGEEAEHDFNATQATKKGALKLAEMLRAKSTKFDYITLWRHTQVCEAGWTQDDSGWHPLNPWDLAQLSE